MTVRGDVEVSFSGQILQSKINSLLGYENSCMIVRQSHVPAVRKISTSIITFL